MTTFNSQSTTSSQSSRKFNLDEKDTRDILVYKMRAGYEISSQKSLCKELDNDPNWRCSRKPISRGTSRLDIKVRDLCDEPERSANAKYPNQQSSIASFGLPTGVYLRRLLLGQFQTLYILSPESSPAGSSAGTSQEPSTGTNSDTNTPDGPTPASTWGAAAAGP